MAKYDLALKKLQQERLEVYNQIDENNDGNTDTLLNIGYLNGLEKAEDIIFKLQKKNDENGQKLWHTGSPNDIKPNNRGTYILQS